MGIYKLNKNNKRQQRENGKKKKKQQTWDCKIIRRHLWHFSYCVWWGAITREKNRSAIKNADSSTTPPIYSSTSTRQLSTLHCSRADFTLVIVWLWLVIVLTVPVLTLHWSSSDSDWSSFSLLPCWLHTGHRLTLVIVLTVPVLTLHWSSSDSDWSSFSLLLCWLHTGHRLTLTGHRSHYSRADFTLVVVWLWLVIVLTALVITSDRPTALVLPPSLLSRVFALKLRRFTQAYLFVYFRAKTTQE